MFYWVLLFNCCQLQSGQDIYEQLREVKIYNSGLVWFAEIQVLALPLKSLKLEIKSYEYDSCSDSDMELHSVELNSNIRQVNECMVNPFYSEQLCYIESPGIQNQCILNHCSYRKYRVTTFSSVKQSHCLVLSVFLFKDTLFSKYD